jgi:hypothetical protein
MPGTTAGNMRSGELASALPPERLAVSGEALHLRQRAAVLRPGGAVRAAIRRQCLG